MTEENHRSKGAQVARNTSLVVALVGLIIALIALLTGSAPNNLALTGFIIAIIGWAAFFTVVLRQGK